jgi:hypothetical protein
MTNDAQTHPFFFRSVASTLLRSYRPVCAPKQLLYINLQSEIVPLSSYAVHMLTSL